MVSEPFYDLSKVWLLQLDNGDGHYLKDKTLHTITIEAKIAYLSKLNINDTVYTPGVSSVLGLDSNNNVVKTTASALAVQSDWNETDNTEPSYINNKPTLTTPVNSDWNATSGLEEILNKPSIPNNHDYVDLISTQSIGGIKKFTNTIKADSLFLTSVPTTSTDTTPTFLTRNESTGKIEKITNSGWANVSLSSSWVLYDANSSAVIMKDADGVVHYSLRIKNGSTSDWDRFGYYNTGSASWKPKNDMYLPCRNGTTSFTLIIYWDSTNNRIIFKHYGLTSSNDVHIHGSYKV